VPTDREAYLHFRPGFAKAMDGRLYNIEYLDGIVESGAALIWWTWDSAIIAEIKEYPTGAKVVHGLVATGHLEEIVNDLIPAAEQFGREIGCIGAIIESREGWAKVLKNKGYGAHQVALWKGL
jgi:hypothetical protein